MLDEDLTKRPSCDDPNHKIKRIFWRQQKTIWNKKLESLRNFNWYRKFFVSDLLWKN
jgi:hypothetical protein